MGTLHSEHACSRAGLAVTADVEERASWAQLAQGAVGAALYWWAGPLSHSLFFRLSAGSLGFMALSVLILIFVLSRWRGLPKACAFASLHVLSVSPCRKGSTLPAMG